VATSEPDLVVQMARTIAAGWESRGLEVEVMADAFVSFNGRPEVRLIDPVIDLGHLTRPVREVVIADSR
jgi:hypothetical protein